MRQVTYDGKLLYSFVEDRPGEVTGDGLEDAFDGQTLTWHVVHPDGSGARRTAAARSGTDVLAAPKWNRDDRK